MIKVYHGSYTAIERVNLSMGGTQRDFGLGFYVTNLLEQANVWATRIGKSRGVDGVVTEFEYSEFLAHDMEMKLLRFDDYGDAWLDFVVLNRKNDSDRQAHDYDIVEGPVADDRITTRVDDYMDGVISREQFLNDFVYNPSHQICFCTVQSLQALSLAKNRIDSAMYHVDDEIVQALMSDYGLNESEAIDLYCTADVYARLSDESTGLYQKPWQEIYEMLKCELKM
jgi:hypothetical protein